MMGRRCKATGLQKRRFKKDLFNNKADFFMPTVYCKPSSAGTAAASSRLGEHLNALAPGV
jgi:hypothetical protein